MTRRFSKYWYLDSDEPRFAGAVRAAFLFNCRDNDLTAGGRIHRGQVVPGKCGWHVAESAIDGLSARPGTFQANRQCSWMGFMLPCLALEALPTGRARRSAYRHQHCIIAEFSNASAAELARSAGLPTIENKVGILLGNLEIASIPRQAKIRRATLL